MICNPLILKCGCCSHLVVPIPILLLLSIILGSVIPESSSIEDQHLLYIAFIKAERLALKSFVTGEVFLKYSSHEDRIRAI